VLAVHQHEKAIRKMIDMGSQEFVTANHIVFDKNDWNSAGEVFKTKPTIRYDGEVFNLTVESEDFDGHSFQLANGTLAHNGKVY
jgi:hypothetical protein